MITLSITADDRGQISLNGPIDNVMLCYGLLEVAKDLVRKHQEQAAKAVVPANGMDLRNLKLTP